MRNIWLVIKHDVGVILQQFSFWVMTLLMPLILVGINAYFVIEDSDALLAGTSSEEDEAAIETAVVPEVQQVGLVDEAGLIMEMPPSIPADFFVRFMDEETAVAALEADDITQVVLIPADYMTTGDITIYDKNFQISRSGAGMGVAFDGDNEWMLQHLIDYNLVRDETTLQLLRDPLASTSLEVHILNPPEVDQSVNTRALASVVASVMPYVFYFLLVMGGNYMMRSVVAEKENRTVEVLLLSLEPQQLMVGKIIAMSVVVLVQIIAWVGSGVLLLNRSATALNVTDFAFPPGFLAWAALFLILGYLLYAAIMTMAGAMAPNAREGAQVMWLLIIPLMPTLMFGSSFLDNPHGALAVTLSLFPMSAPSAMVTRIAVAQVPLWQIILSLSLLAVTTYLVVGLAGRFFRTDNLLSGASFNMKRFVLGWRQ